MQEPTLPEFDVALSFAGEDRAFVEAVVAGLEPTGYRVFYDADRDWELWGQDLVEYFDQIYRLKSRYAILFISRHYAAKMWPRHERRSALARGLEQVEPYVLPVRLDDTALDGLRPTVGYLDARRVGVEGIVASICAKLSGAASSIAHEITGVPRDEVGRQALLLMKPAGWEYLYLAAQLLQELALAEPKYRDHMFRYAERTGQVVDRSAFWQFFKVATDDAARMVESVSNFMNPQVLNAATNAPDGDEAAERMAHLARRWNGLYIQLMDWAARLRGASVPGDAQPLVEALARFVDDPVDKYRQVIDRLVRQLDHLPQRIAAGEHIIISEAFEIRVPPEVSAACDVELKKLKKKWSS
ncbi:MAG TPA: TIR domain-containing protein [Jatrophihabitans sp.]|nr:TIR domain-containing protein [Jatrophihabitans sp.]